MLVYWVVSSGLMLIKAARDKIILAHLDHLRTQKGQGRFGRGSFATDGCGHGRPFFAL